MDEPLAKAHQAIGAYFCAFSELEHELGEALKIVLRLQNNPAADAIVAAVRDFARKAAIVREAIEGAKNVDGSEPSSEWKSNALKTMEAVFGCNNPDRRDLSHDYLKPQPDGSISLQKPGEPARPWSAADFDRKIQKLKNLTNELRSAGTQLMTYKVQIPVPSNWMARNVPELRLNSNRLLLFVLFRPSPAHLCEKTAAEPVGTQAWRWSQSGGTEGRQ